MRTQDPANIRRDFDASIDDIETAFDASEAGVQDEAARKLIAEYLFVAAATVFEGFVSDLFVAYINRDSQRFRDHVLGNMTIETDDEFAKRSAQYVQKSIPALSVDKIREILNPSGFNISFKTTDKMKEAAGTWLPDADKTKFTGVPADLDAVIDFIKAVRNYLAHRSQAADNRMQNALTAGDLPASLRRNANNVSDVGAYLRAVQGDSPRFGHALAQIRQLSAQFCP